MVYSKAPLPFIGQKKNWLKTIGKIDFSGCTVLDLFGGSGLMSHYIKQHYPSATVIYNDYDRYCDRLALILETEQLRQKLVAMLSDVPTKTKLTKDQKNQVIEMILESGCKDYLTLSSWFLFSSRSVSNFDDFIKTDFFNGVSKTPLDAAGYLDDLVIEHDDFLSVYDKYKDHENLVVLIDPPYLFTYQDCYSNKTKGLYFGIKQTVNALKLFQQSRGILFCSNKSEIDELLELFEIKPTGLLERGAHMSRDQRYIDQLYLFNMGYSLL